MLQVRLMEKRRELRRDEVNALIDDIAGVTLTALSSLPARCASRGDLAIRRSIERVVFEVRTEIAKVCLEMADKHGEPPLSEQDRSTSNSLTGADTGRHCGRLTRRHALN